MSNWQRKSDYLLREIVKFRTYAESLQAAALAREKVLARRAEREAELAVIRARAAAEQAPVVVEEVERLPLPDEDLDGEGEEEFEDAMEGRDVTPRGSEVPPAAAVAAAAVSAA